MPIVSLPAAAAVWTCTSGKGAQTAPAVTFSARRRVIRRTRVMGCSSCCTRFYLYFFELTFRCLRYLRCRRRPPGTILALVSPCRGGLLRRGRPLRLSLSRWPPLRQTRLPGRVERSLRTAIGNGLRRFH